MKKCIFGPNRHPRVTVVQLGARLHYSIPLILEKEGLLHRFITDTYAGSGSWLSFVRYVPSPVRRVPWIRSLAQRSAEICGARVQAHNLFGLKYFAQRLVNRSQVAKRWQAHLDARDTLGSLIREYDI